MVEKNRISPCPSPEALAKSLRNKLSAGEREDLIDHLLVCPECRIKVDVLGEVRTTIESHRSHFRPLAAESRREIRAARRNGLAASAFKLPRRRWAFAAAGLLLIIAAGSTAFMVSTGRPFPRFRGSGNEVLKLRTPLLLSDGKTLLFRWEPYPEADNYYFKLLDEELNMIRGESKATAFILDTEKHKTFMIPGKTFVWSVEVKNDPGWVIASQKATFLFEEK